MKATNGRSFGRPPLGNPSKYLLTNLARCGCCGGPLKVRSRKHGKGRKFFYPCSWHEERGQSVCKITADVPMEDADAIVIEALLDDVLDESIIADAVDAALRLVQGEGAAERLEALDTELSKVDRECTRLVDAG